MLLSGFIHGSTARLEKLYPSPEARGLVLMLLEERIGTKSYTHVIEPLCTVPEDALEGLEDDVRRLERGEPIQYVLGVAEFCGRRFKVGPSVLVPRPETELLVQEAAADALRRPAPVRILDLCTGSGCIAWSLALEVPDSEVTAVDISEPALSLARESLEGPRPNSPRFVNADVLDTEASGFDGQYDVLVSNPPYVMESEKSGMRPNVLDWEPSLALFVPDSDPLVFYRAIAAHSFRMLVPGGCGYVEINEGLGPETAAVFEAAGLCKVRTIQDFCGKNRIIAFQKQAF